MCVPYCQYALLMSPKTVSSNIFAYHFKCDPLRSINSRIRVLPCSGKTFEGENSRELVKIRIFSEKLLRIARSCLRLWHQRTPLPQISRRKLSRIATKFLSESFPLYAILPFQVPCYIDIIVYMDMHINLREKLKKKKTISYPKYFLMQIELCKCGHSMFTFPTI